MVQQEIKFGSGEYEVTVSFDSTSTINFYNSEGILAAQLQPDELTMLTGAYQAFLDAETNRTLREKKLRDRG